MKIIAGKYAAAHVMTDDVEQAAIDQVENITNGKFSEGQKIAVMPDVHAGKGGPIGLVMTVGDKIVPNLVSVDIGCGVYAYKIGENDFKVDFENLQRVIDAFVPSGRKVHDAPALGNRAFGFSGKFKMPVSKDQIQYLDRSIGTLGGGNHFISVEVGESGTYLLIHSGSRNLGTMVARHYQELAVKNIRKVDNSKLIAALKAAGRHKEIAAELAKVEVEVIDPDLAYLEGQDAKNYLIDMAAAQLYAHLNRETMAKTIFYHMDWEYSGAIRTQHNYIDTERGILRKGAVAAYVNEPFLVPLNMRDGTLIFVAEEERPDWLFSAPHGAGRRLSRTQAKKNLSMEDYESGMEGIWSASVNENTLDEAPEAYKNAETIADLLEDVYTLCDHLKPVFNFKANN